MESNYLSHHGILGQKWGDRNGPPYPLNYNQKNYSERQANRLDKRWSKKNEKKIRRYAETKSREELRDYDKTTLRKNMRARNSDGSLSKNYINAYNQKMAVLMSQSVKGLSSPSGRVVQFVAKRGEIGVYMALADPGFDMTSLKNGLHSSGRVAYRKKQVDYL